MRYDFCKKHSRYFEIMLWYSNTNVINKVKNKTMRIDLRKNLKIKIVAIIENIDLKKNDEIWEIKRAIEFVIKTTNDDNRCNVANSIFDFFV